PVLRDVCWDIDNLYNFNDVKDFDLEELSLRSGIFVLQNGRPVFTIRVPFTANDYKVLLYALRYSNWFTGLVFAQRKVDKEVFGYIADLVQENTAITKLVLRDIGLTRDSAIQLAYSLNLHNSQTIKQLELARNPIEVKL